MPDASSLLASLALALLAAGFSGAIAASLRQSVIVGYIIAGIVISPYTPGYVADSANVEALAEIGIVLLLFVTGMEVSFRELSRVGTVAVVGALIQVVILIVLGFLVGKALGWADTPAFVLGAVVSNSSSTVISKVVTERGDGGSRYSRLGLAWSSIQDLSTIVLVVIITAMATGGEDVLSDTAVEVGKAALFLTILVPVGGRLLPFMFTRIRAIGQREVFLLSTAALGLLTAYVASLFGLSPALGAFVAGVVLGESDIRHEVIDGLGPIRDIFVGLFFVSIGMLVDPGFLLSEAGIVLTVLGLIIVVKGPVSAAILWAFRVDGRVNIMASASLAQSAEFSFLLATVGVGLGVLTEHQFSTLVAGAALSVVASPWVLEGSSRLGQRVERAGNDDLRTSDRDEASPDLFGHVVMCGHGRVGSVVTAALASQGVQVAIIDQEPHTVSELRDQGYLSLMGRADNPRLLERAGLSDAAILVIAVPDVATVRRVVRMAREMNPHITIVSRTHTAEERDHLEANGVDEAVVGETELALEMARYALRVRRVDPVLIEEHISDVRHSSDGAG
ncbi:MAG: cation:proton antiporter [Dehalococcoidia bacterium]|nr:cation:proton antiporter [Dehalococcoidia bacterium]